MIETHETNASSSSPEDDVRSTDRLIERFLPTLEAYVRLHMGSHLLRREEATDVVQSTCREALVDRPPGHWESESGFRRWLLACAESKLRDRARYWRRAKRDAAREAGRHPHPYAGGLPALETPVDELTPSRAAMAREEVSRIEAALIELAPEERSVILMSRFAGLSSREIGERLGKSETAARKMAARATARLVMRLHRR